MHISHSVLKQFPLLARLQNYFRQKRVQRFVEMLDIKEGTRILDVGGEPYFWEHFPVKCQIVCLNIHAGVSSLEHVSVVEYDGKSLPYEDQSFDIVHSNSVIEHVGDFFSQLHFAREIHRVGKRYWVQVPNFYFPWEPHAFLPLYQFLPANIKMIVSKYWTKPTYGIEDLLSIRLLTVREVRYLFADAKIFRERFLGLTKSICAYN